MKRLATAVGNWHHLSWIASVAMQRFMGRCHGAIRRQVINARFYLGAALAIRTVVVGLRWRR